MDIHLYLVGLNKVYVCFKMDIILEGQLGISDF